MLFAVFSALVILMAAFVCLTYLPIITIGALIVYIIIAAYKHLVHRETDYGHDDLPDVHPIMTLKQDEHDRPWFR